MQKTALQTFLLLITCGISLSAFSDTRERRYAVEMVIYKHTKAEYFRTEHWPEIWNIPDLTDSVSLIRPDKKHQDLFQLQKKPSAAFEGILKSLDESSRYEILLHRHWQQAGLNKNEALGVRLGGGTRYISETQLTEALPPTTGSLFLTDTAENNYTDLTDTDYRFSRNNQSNYSGQTGTHRVIQYRKAGKADRDAVYELDGTVKVVLSRFLHIYTDLLLLKPVHIDYPPPATKAVSLTENESDNSKQQATTEEKSAETYRIALADPDETFTTLHGFNIKEHRRMRSGELHHIDHPLLGIIIKISPIENPSE